MERERFRFLNFVDLRLSSGLASCPIESREEEELDRLPLRPLEWCRFSSYLEATLGDFLLFELAVLVGRSGCFLILVGLSAFAWLRFAWPFDLFSLCESLTCSFFRSAYSLPASWLLLIVELGVLDGELSDFSLDFLDFVSFELFAWIGGPNSAVNSELLDCWCFSLVDLLFSSRFACWL